MRHLKMPNCDFMSNTNNDRSQSTVIRETAGGVVLNQEGEILVTCQRGDSWSLPKGGIDGVETAREAAEREIYEETGVRDLIYVKELGSYERYRIGTGGVGEDRSQLKRIHMFLFTTQHTELNPIDPENTEARWVSRDQVIDVLTHMKDKEFMESFLKAD
jgi:8-oxo-dGTP diphosphatase